MRKAFLFSLLMILTVMLILSCSKDKKTNPDTESPTVIIAYPPNNSSFVSGTIINIVAEAEDNEEVDNVKFYIDGVNSYQDSNEPYEYSWDTTDLSGSHTIYAKAADSSENTATSDIVTVTITDESEAPNPPTNPIPTSESTDISINTTLSWTCTDPNGDQLTYDVYFGTTTTPLLVSTDLTVCSFVPGTLQEETIYYWYVEATDTDENTTIGPLWSFTTLTGGSGGQPPNPPSNPNPSDYDTDVSIDKNLSWFCTDPDGDPLTYDVYFGISSTPPLINSGQSTSTYELETLDYGEIYYWQIVAHDDHSNSTTGDIWQFTTCNIGPSPSNPILVGEYMPNSGVYRDIKISDNYAYIAANFTGLVILDISDPSNPIMVSEFDHYLFAAQTVTIDNNYAFVSGGFAGSDDGAVLIIDISNPSSPEFVSIYETNQSCYSTYILGETLYITNLEHGLQIIDISNLSSPQYVGSCSSIFAVDIFVSGNYAILADWSAGVKIINIANQSNPILVNSITGFNAYDLYVNGIYAYFAGRNGGLVIMDLSSQYHPDYPIVGICDTSDALGVHTLGNYVYIADSTEGLKIINVSNVNEPVIIGTHETNGIAHELFACGYYVYVVEAQNGLEIFQIGE